MFNWFITLQIPEKSFSCEYIHTADVKHVARSLLLRHCNGQLITVVTARQHTCLGSDSDPKEKCEQSEMLMQVLTF